MSEDYNMSYSFQMNSRGEADKQSELFAAVAAHPVAISDDHVLLIDKCGDGQLIVTPEVAVALAQHCQCFRTLDQHAVTVVEQTPQLAGHLQDVKNVLQAVQQAGLMVSAEQVCRQWAAASQDAGLAPSRVFVITCDRPAAVERLLDSMLQSTNLSQHQQLFLVDDSREMANGLANLELVQKFNLTSASEMTYVGAEQLAALMHQLITALPHAESAIRFLIDRQQWRSYKTYGLSRTVCLLLSVGYRSIVLDDDVLCRAVPSPRAEQGVDIGGGSRELDVYDSESALMQSVTAAASDPLLAHSQALGLRQGELVSKLKGAELTAGDLRDVDYSLLAKLDANAPVLVTQCGSIGDPGTGGAHFLHRLSEDSIARLLSSPGGLQQALSSRQCRLGRDKSTFTRIALMSAMTGLDNTHLLPPYFPVHRGEDYLFGAMLEFLYPQSAAIDFNWAIPHIPIEQRSSNGDSARKIAAVGGVGMFAAYIIEHSAQEPGPSEFTRLTALSQLLMELAESSDQTLSAMYRRELAQDNAQQMKTLGQALKVAPENASEWRNYLQAGIAEVSAAIQQLEHPAQAPGIPAGLADAEVYQAVREATRSFAEALEVWPEIREAAGDIDVSTFI